jgi:hypothetical protein
MKDALYALATMLCGVGFYCAIIGVFELPAACLSLALFIALVVSVVRERRWNPLTTTC